MEKFHLNIVEAQNFTEAQISKVRTLRVKTMLWVQNP
jgi:hypothetical protein